MNRRMFLAGMVVGVFTASGCTSHGSSESNDPNGQGIANREFSITNKKPSQLFDDKPAVKFDSKANQVMVTGKMWVGNPGHEPKLKTAEYDEEADTLDVMVGVEKTSQGCPDSLGASKYEAVISFGNGLPGTVTTTEKPPDGPDGWDSQSRTVER